MEEKVNERDGERGQRGNIRVSGSRIICFNQLQHPSNSDLIIEVA